MAVRGGKAGFYDRHHLQFLREKQGCIEGKQKYRGMGAYVLENG
jgi:hypothetical protein